MRIETLSVLPLFQCRYVYSGGFTITTTFGSYSILYVNASGLLTQITHRAVGAFVTRSAYNYFACVGDALLIRAESVSVTEVGFGYR